MNKNIPKTLRVAQLARILLSLAESKINLSFHEHSYALCCEPFVFCGKLMPSFFKFNFIIVFPSVPEPPRYFFP
jgi:hypothetical protein